MELGLLRSFLALVGQLHFGRTARLLNVSQPALTKGFGNWNRKSGDNFFVAVAMGLLWSVPILSRDVLLQDPFDFGDGRRICY
jgi:hypothetical protein